MRKGKFHNSTVVSIHENTMALAELIVEPCSSGYLIAKYVGHCLASIECYARQEAIDTLREFDIELGHRLTPQ
jgi:hypothetical protein